MADVELETTVKRRNLFRVNSWAKIYHDNTARRKSLKLLGEAVMMDDWLDWRVKWAQRGIGFFSLTALICFILAGGINVGLRIATIVFLGIVAMCTVLLYYKNISLVIVKRLLTETNVVVIIILTIANWIIEIGRPMTPMSPVFGFLYMVAVNGFLFIDAVKLKSRLFVIIVGSICTVLSMNNIYGNTFGNSGNGVVLFDYTVQGKEYTIMKRSTQRSIFLQVLLFSMTAVYILLKDKKMELMIFATGNINRETGTAWKDVDGKTLREENPRSSSSVQARI
eukprot:g9253.t1